MAHTGCSNCLPIVGASFAGRQLGAKALLAHFDSGTDDGGRVDFGRVRCRLRSTVIFG